jgi:ERCC4-related helicase
MTPQTLINDLTTECCDARDIILMVIGMSTAHFTVSFPHVLQMRPIEAQGTMLTLK